MAYLVHVVSFTLQGYLGEILAGIALEHWGAQGQNDWYVPAFLFRTHDQEFQHLESINERLLRGEDLDPDAMAERRPGRTGDDCLAFRIDNHNKIIDVAMIEAKCLGDHNSATIGQAHSKFLENQHRLSGVRELVNLLEDYDAEASQRRQVEYLESLLLTNGDTPYSDELRLWMDDGLFNVGTYQPQISALHDLESSGQTQIIQNQDLRRVLASVRQKMNDLEIAQRDFQLSQQMLIDPFLVDHFNLSNLMLDRAANSETNLAVLGTSDFQSRVAFKISLRGEVSQSQHEVRVAFTEALELIEAELETTNGS